MRMRRDNRTRTLATLHDRLTRTAPYRDPVLERPEYRAGGTNRECSGTEGHRYLGISYAIEIIDAFIARLHVLLDTPTVVRPVAVAPSAGGRHRLAEPAATVAPARLRG